MATTLKKKRDFKRVFGLGTTIKGSFFSLHYVVGYGDKNQFAYIIPKKQVSKATIRNKIRRRLKELVRTARTATIKKGIVGVFVVKSRAQKASAKEFKEEINKTINKIKM